jgi:hypothetical protein
MSKALHATLAMQHTTSGHMALSDGRILSRGNMGRPGRLAEQSNFLMFGRPWGIRSVTKNKHL